MTFRPAETVYDQQIHPVGNRTFQGPGRVSQAGFSEPATGGALAPVFPDVEGFISSQIDDVHLGGAGGQSIGRLDQTPESQARVLELPGCSLQQILEIKMAPVIYSGNRWHGLELSVYAQVVAGRFV